ncbi:MAG: hypothetical protein SAK29_29090 [Scytonema sp. PMC 1069.18]|nr:hypothetical protein [Scytonema sp. PMC 1069.18]MEC4888090.1 hypothetical protein [Scytonema sp. PMC 1070.18]
MSGKGRIAVTLEADVYEWIVDTAKRDGRTPANLAAHLLTQAVRAEQNVDSKSETTTNKEDAA